jgi:hypothetical protein
MITIRFARRHRLDLIVRHVDDRRLQPVVELGDLGLGSAHGAFASRFDSGSSNRKTHGFRTIARPIATRCR